MLLVNINRDSIVICSNYVFVCCVFKFLDILGGGSALPVNLNRDIILICSNYVFCLFVYVLEILGGGFALGSLVMVMEDTEAPHHMLLLRNFMSQGLVHNQPLLYASPSRDPRTFLGTLPNPASSKDDKSHNHDTEQVSPFGLLPLPISLSFTRSLPYVVEN